MKNLIVLSLFFCSICFTTTSFGQATFINGANTPNSSTDFLGWATTSLGTVTELTIKNDESMPIAFYTNAGGGLTNMRMWIYETGGSFNDGFVGIGDFASVGATPQNLLHLINAYNKPVFTQWTNAGLSGHNANNGLLVGSLMSGVARLLLAELT